MTTTELQPRRRARRLIGCSILATLGFGALGCTAGGRSGHGDEQLTPDERVLAGDYVALGDSFSSGEGAPDLDFDEDGNPCHRSDYAYAQRIADEFPFSGEQRIVTCSGAHSQDILEPGPNGEPAQIDAVDDHTSLVTIGISGNDARWSSVLETCLLHKLDDCRGTEDEARERMVQAADKAREVYEAVRSRAGDDARIIAVGYPRFFPEEPTDELLEYEVACVDPPILDRHCALSVRITPGEQEYLNAMAHEFDQMLAERADAAGIEFVDTAYDAFAGHELGTDATFFNGLVFGWPDCGFPTSLGGVAVCLRSIVQDESFHPNAAGQQRMAELVVDQIRNP